MTEDRVESTAFKSPRLSPLIKGLLIAQGIYALLTIPLYPVLGLSVGPLRLVGLSVSCLFVLAGLAYFYRFRRGGRGAWALSEALLATLILIMHTNIASPSQYLAISLGMPLIDSTLAAADQTLGVSVQALNAWTAQMPTLAAVLRVSYYSLIPQFAVALVWLGIIDRDLERLWEYSFHFHFCLFVTAFSLALFPAKCVFTHLGFESLLDQTRFTTQFEGFRSGAMTHIRWNDLEGMISIPSFHVAGGMLVTWAFRHRPIAFSVFLILNLGMLAATVMLGAHYFVDLIATVGLFGLSVYCYSRFVGSSWMSEGMSRLDYQAAKRKGSA